jgi:hypothetical protein
MSKKGQSILEYVIILSVIVAAIAIAANGGLRTTVGNLINNSSTSIGGAASKIGAIGS